MILSRGVIQLISPSQSCDNLFITYLCLYQASNKEIACIFLMINSKKLTYEIKTVFLVVLPFLFSSKRFKPIDLNTMFEPCVRNLKCSQPDKKTISGTKNDIRVRYRFYVLLLSI